MRRSGALKLVNQAKRGGAAIATEEGALVLDQLEFFYVLVVFPLICYDMSVLQWAR